MLYLFFVLNLWLTVLYVREDLWVCRVLGSYEYLDPFGALVQVQYSAGPGTYGGGIIIMNTVHLS